MCRPTISRSTPVLMATVIMATTLTMRPLARILNDTAREDLQLRTTVVSKIRLWRIDPLQSKWSQMMSDKVTQRRRFLMIVAAAAAVIAVGAQTGDARPKSVPAGIQADNTLPAPDLLAARCQALSGTTVDGVRVTASERIAAGVAANPAAICKVNGTREPFLDIEVDLPDNWSGRLYHQGGGGFDGVIGSAIAAKRDGSIASISKAIVEQGAVFVASNGGNRANVAAEAAPAVWANGTPAGTASADDYAYKAVGTSIGFAKALAKAVYGRKPTHSYFVGCSNGGRNAYIAAQRWPDEYDGIVAGCEPMDISGQTSAWMNLGARKGTAAALTPTDWSVVYTAALARCDVQDGVADGVIADAAGCMLQPEALQCKAEIVGKPATNCLSPAQVATVKSVIGVSRLRDGTTVYAGYRWADFSRSADYGANLGGAYVFLATGDKSWFSPAKQQTFDLDRDYPKVRRGLSERGVDHDKAAVAAYVASGKKLIAWHDGADELLSSREHERNYALMLDMARKAGLTSPRTNSRFFIVPGQKHGVGMQLTEIDWFAAIVDWVEHEKAPEQLTFSFSANGSPRTIPVCEAPSFPRYIGGPVSLAASYACTPVKR